MLVINDTKNGIPLIKLSDADKSYVFSLVEKDRVLGVGNSGTQYLDRINELKECFNDGHAAFATELNEKSCIDPRIVKERNQSELLPKVG